MAIPTDELSLLIRDWYYAASEGKAEQFINFFLKDDSTTYIGTDPDEQWYGFDQIRAGFEETFETYGKWSIMSKFLNVYQSGEVAYFSDEVELSARLGDSSMAEMARMSGVLVRRDGKWGIIQAHLSIGIPNRQLLPG